MATQYPMLADVIKTTNTSTSFHLAEENKKDEDVRDYIHAHALTLFTCTAAKVTEEMACRCLISTRFSADGDDGNVDYCDYDQW